MLPLYIKCFHRSIKCFHPSITNVEVVKKAMMLEVVKKKEMLFEEKKRICYAINNQFKKILLEASDEKKSELSSDIEKIENELNTCQDLSLNTIKIISENSENLRHLLKKS